MYSIPMQEFLLFIHFTRFTHGYIHVVVLLTFISPLRAGKN